jgi:hypothetical protein
MVVSGMSPLSPAAASMFAPVCTSMAAGSTWWQAAAYTSATLCEHKADWSCWSAPDASETRHAMASAAAATVWVMNDANLYTAAAACWVCAIAPDAFALAQQLMTSQGC